MGCLGRMAGAIFILALVLTGLYYLIQPAEYTEADYSTGECAVWASNWRYFKQVACDDDHDFELVGKAEIPGGYRCSAKDCYFGDLYAPKSLAAAAAAACEPVALAHGRLTQLPAGVEANGRGSVSAAQRAGGQPFAVWCEVRPVGTQPLQLPLEEMR